MHREVEPSQPPTFSISNASGTDVGAAVGGTLVAGTLVGGTSVVGTLVVGTAVTGPVVGGTLVVAAAVPTTLVVAVAVVGTLVGGTAVDGSVVDADAFEVTTNGVVVARAVVVVAGAVVLGGFGGTAGMVVRDVVAGPGETVVVPFGPTELFGCGSVESAPARCSGSASLLGVETTDDMWTIVGRSGVGPASAVEITDNGGRRSDADRSTEEGASADHSTATPVPITTIVA